MNKKTDLESGSITVIKLSIDSDAEATVADRDGGTGTGFEVSLKHKLHETPGKENRQGECHGQADHVKK
jgi:hypothetical protein